MIIGVPKEIKTHEYRVGIMPFGVEELKKDGHTILIETDAGEGSGFTDDEYLKADADIVDRETVFKKADLLVKVKEPLPSEYDSIKNGQAIFTYLHLAPNRELTELLLNKKVTALAYETLQKDGNLPLLAPMSEIAGRIAPLMGAYYLQRIHGGSGILPTGATGVKPANALILGAGNVGANAARVCIGMDMDTVIMNRGMERLQRLDELFIGKIKTLPLTAHNIKEEIQKADIIIGAVLVPGGKTPVLVTRDMLKTMKKGSVIVDVSVDQGGCVETTKPTTHDNPVYSVEGILHYTVANMPGAYPRTSTLALTNATLPYIKTIAKIGIRRAIMEDEAIKSALNVYGGEIMHKAIADSLSLPYKDIAGIL
ncbi:MAG: alanine dehydrogenase [Nitrospirae bacterium GWC2_46_6]|nr:MAG: alanine dehydrogenase [Nitrospirae bacterium GWA2_46_11]OGW23331.1 MAG: alanine dehydrogenase [Nitrospirae bacterium GWC2_46_6]OGW24927.1 MAG: alanine dehydrogenase [Nitrospirae bacterium GWB2_47_37]HAK88253.1 alanine dehydrogenase [Nitrospiraceae bacterium]